MIRYHEDLIQGSDEWLAARCGLLTASEMHLILTPTLKIADNDKTRAHIHELLAQRITRYVEPQYVSDAMLRGQDDEIEARALYAEKYLPVREVGFVTNDDWGFTIGYSPDGLVGEDGLIEVKSRGQKFQVATIAADAMPDDYSIQVQTGMLVTGRSWCDYISYSGGLPMFTKRVFADAKVHDAIIAAATAFEARIVEKRAAYQNMLRSDARLIPTERRIVQEMFA
jgi:predicted phage-related endonuclease